jgi:hypothetical protein
LLVSLNNILLVVKITAMNDRAMNREWKDETRTILQFFSTCLWNGAEEYEYTRFEPGDVQATARLLTIAGKA